MKFGENILKKEFNSEPVYLMENDTRERSTQIFAITKYQEKVVSLFVYQ